MSQLTLDQLPEADREAIESASAMKMVNQILVLTKVEWASTEETQT